MDSMSSGHSSGDHVLGLIPSNNAETMKQQQRGRASKPTVMPYEDQPDQDETPVYLTYVSYMFPYFQTSEILRFDKMLRLEALSI